MLKREDKKKKLRDECCLKREKNENESVRDESYLKRENKRPRDR